MEDIRVPATKKKSECSFPLALTHILTSVIEIFFGSGD